MENISFFDNIKSQIPSLDSDLSSSSDNEEEISVYQRPSLFSFPQGAKVDPNYLSSEEPGVEDLLKSVTESFSYKVDDDLSDQKDELTPLLAAEHDDHLTQVGHETEKDFISSTEAESHDFADHPKSSDQKRTLAFEQKRNNSKTNNAERECASPELSKLRTERLKDICGSHFLEKEEKMHTQPYPILSLKPLENWDLDQVLQSLKQHTGQRKDASEEGEMMKFQSIKYTDYGNERQEINIMDQLTTFCMKQPSAKMDTKTINLSAKSHSKPQRSYMKTTATRRNTDKWGSDFSGIADKLHLKNYNSPTIYIDLRNTDHQTKPAVTCNTFSCPDRLKQSLSTERVRNTQLEAARRNGMPSGKSLLLQKIRESKSIAEDSAKPQKETLGIRKDQNSCGNPPLIKHQDKTSFLTTACDEAPIDKTLSSSKKTAVEPQKEESDQVQKEEQMNMAQRQQYLKHLLTLKPQRSVNNKRSAAEMTDVLYDTDGSHLPSVSTLAPNLQSSECLLLTVTLSSPGVVAGRAQGKTQTVESTSVKSHVYNSLIAWFMSLAKPNSCSMKETARNAGNSPFLVAGLQQFWRNGLVLYVCAVSTEERQPLCIKPRSRNEEKGQTLFHKRVSKFLSQTQLRTVVSWLPQLNLVLQQHAHPALFSLPSSCLDCFISINPDKEAVVKAFGISPGFYWQTLETKEQICQRAEALTSPSHTEVVVALGCRLLFLDPLATHYTLHLLLSSGLDVCGLRLIYPSEELLTNSAVCVTGEHNLEYVHQPVLALTIRGPYASSVWQEIIGPSDPQVAQKTDPASINALYCRSQYQPLFLYPRLASRVHLSMCVWFGGRLPRKSLMVTENIQKFKDKEDGAFYTETSSTSTLCATVKGDVFLIVSPVVAPCCYSYVLSACAKKGFQLIGLQRVQISRKRASSLGLTSEQMPAFCHAPTVFLDGEQLELYSKCLVLLLRKENALHHCASLSTGLMNELAVQGLVGILRTRLAGDVLLPDLCFHAVPYTENLFNFLGGLMWTLPDFSHVMLSKHRYPSCSKVEQIVILTLTGRNIMEEGINLLHKVFTGNVAGGAGEEKFELLALKWLPTLSQRQAQELSPYEVGDRLWQSSVLSLASSPALVCVLRRLQAFGTLQRLLPQDYPGNLSVLMSCTPEMAFRQATLFFTEEELIPDHSSRTMLKFLPPLSMGLQSQSFYSYMTEGPQPLLTLALFKPGVWRHCLGKILSRIQQNGFTLVGLRMLVLDSKMAHAVMNAPVHQGHSERELELEYLKSGPALALCLQRVNAVKMLLELLGPEDPAQAGAENQLLWRAIYGSDRLHNGIYGLFATIVWDIWPNVKAVFEPMSSADYTSLCPPDVVCTPSHLFSTLSVDSQPEKHNSNKGSLSYHKSVQDVKMMFSDGLCCAETSVMKHKQIPCLRSDPVASLERQRSHTIAPIAKNKFSQSFFEESGLIRGCLVRSALCQTTCLLMPSSLLQLSRPPLHLDLLEQLLRAGCLLVAGRLCTPDKFQRRHIFELLRPPGGEAIHESFLPEGPCLILALQKDNAVTCFDLILESICRGRPDIERVAKMLLYPSSENEAVKLLCYLFDGLSPDSHHIILPQQS